MEFFEKQMSYERKKYVTIPAGPGSHLRVIHSEVLLAFAEALLDSPTYQGRSPDFIHGRVNGYVTRGVLLQPILKLPDLQPYVLAGHIVSNLAHSYVFVLGHYRALGTYAEDDVLPWIGGLSGDFTNLPGSGNWLG
ncbi:MAG: hypothetical protein LBD41_00955, partial [Clostridiales Family XIII bacterium]|nr:hypothetical protein [Clostridiales Family XIII bacterium]